MTYIDTEFENYVKIVSWKRESESKLINIKPGKPYDVNQRLKHCLVNLVSKDTHLVFSIYISDSLAFQVV